MHIWYGAAWEDRTDYSNTPFTRTLGGEMAEAPDDYVLADGGLYTEVSGLTSPDGVNYQELAAETLAANPVEIALTLPGDADASPAGYRRGWSSG